MCTGIAPDVEEIFKMIEMIYKNIEKQSHMYIVDIVLSTRIPDKEYDIDISMSTTC
jgi:hypothetical protein